MTRALGTADLARALRLFAEARDPHCVLLTMDLAKLADALESPAIEQPLVYGAGYRDGFRAGKGDLDLVRAANTRLMAEREADAGTQGAAAPGGLSDEEIGRRILSAVEFAGCGAVTRRARELLAPLHTLSECSHSYNTGYRDGVNSVPAPPKLPTVEELAIAVGESERHMYWPDQCRSIARAVLRLIEERNRG